jgi:O-antigen/teichoic acid export membrane protein
MFGLKEKIQYLYQHSFVRNVATLQAGSFMGNFIQAGIGVVIARILQPELFGVYSLAFGLASLICILLSSGIQDAVSALLGAAYARKDREEVIEILSFTVKITVILALITLMATIFLPNIAGYFYHNRSIGYYAGIMVAASILSTLLFSLTTIALQLTGKIIKMSALIVSDQAIRYGFSLLFVFMGLGVWGASLGHFFGAIIIFIISVILWGQIRRGYEIFPSLIKIIGNLWQINIKKHLGFSLWVAVDRNMGSLYMALPIILTGIYVPVKDVSYFRLAFGYVNLALSMLGPVSILLNVEFPKMIVEDGKKLARNFVKVSLVSMFLSCLLTVTAIVTAPFIFKILYGASYVPSIKYVSGLLVYGALFGLGVGLGPMWRAINRVKVSIVINFVILGAGIPLGLWLIKNYGLWGSVTMVTIWFTISHLISFGYLAKKLQKV